MKVGDIYRHKKTQRLYEIVVLSKRERDHVPLVTYKDKIHCWTRTIEEFMDGRFEYHSHNAPFSPMNDIEAFHQRFDLSYEGLPRCLPAEVAQFRTDFLFEEAAEYKLHQEAALDETTRPPDYRDDANYSYHLSESLDGLVDLVYVALGNAYLQGFNFREAWRRVHQANMSKVRAKSSGDSKRGNSFDVVKPPEWEAPDHTDLVEVNNLGESQ